LYGQTDSTVADSARQRVAQLNEWFAAKDYDTGMFYFRNKAWDSSILYFKDLVSKWPEAKHARMAMLRLAEAYRTIHYGEDLADICKQMRSLYPGDREVVSDCRGVKLPSDTTSVPGDTSRGPAPPFPPPR
jgi:outer membrane protein assembly factor BamD (BamD/ComL family)